MSAPCLLCGGELRLLGAAGRRPGSVTSDSRQCALPARIWQCGRCGHLQKAPDAHERAAIDAVYAAYAAHHLSGGREQLAFVPGRAPRPRSQHAFEQLRDALPASGRLLDVGTGAGAILMSAAAALPGWELHAFDVSSHRRAEIQRLAGVSAFYSGSLESVPALSFDLIVLWHVLEHVDDPARLLRDLRGRLGADGRILIQVPDLDRNPYDLAVIDHASHFSARHLEALARGCGFTVVVDGRRWFHNCLTVLLASSNGAADDAVARAEALALPDVIARAEALALPDTMARTEAVAVPDTMARAEAVAVPDTMARAEAVAVPDTMARAEAVAVPDTMTRAEAVAVPDTMARAEAVAVPDTIARAEALALPHPLSPHVARGLQPSRPAFGWLAATVEHFEVQRGAGDYAIFGTGMAGIWLAGQLGQPPACFIDEDESRWGQTVAGVPVVGPTAATGAMPIVLAFDAPTGEAIAARLRRQYPVLRASALVLSLPAVPS